jgi:hypothetical protein
MRRGSMKTIVGRGQATEADLDVATKWKETLVEDIERLKAEILKEKDPRVLKNSKELMGMWKKMLRDYDKDLAREL